MKMGATPPAAKIHDGTVLARQHLPKTSGDRRTERVEQRKAEIRISVELLHELLDLPSWLHIRGAKAVDPWTVALMVEGQHLSDSSEGEVPVITPEFETYYQTCAKLVNIQGLPK
jgi:hypothetical protein